MPATATSSGASVYALLVGLGAQARGAERQVLAAQVAARVGQHFDALMVTLHASFEGWAEVLADRSGVMARLTSLSRARVETLDARLAALAHERDGRASALDLDSELAGEALLADLVGATDVFAMPLRAGGRSAGAVVLYLGPRSAAPSETDLMALSGLGDVLALGRGAPASQAPPEQRPTPPSAPGFLRRLLSR